MLKFFKKIRRNQLKEGHLKQYFVYAIGETLLVMVGILLALQVNNWNENRKEQKIEREYLIALQEEFSTNLKALNFMIKQNKSCIGNAGKLAQKIEQGPSQLSEKEFSELFGETFKYTTRYNPSLGVLKDLVNSGHLNHISNPQLRKKIAAWESKLLRIKRQEETVYLNQQSIVELLKKNGSFRRIINETSGEDIMSISPGSFTRSNKVLIQNPELENNLLFFIVTSQTLNEGYYQNLKKEIQTILETLEEEIK